MRKPEILRRARRGGVYKTSLTALHCASIWGRIHHYYHIRSIPNLGLGFALFWLLLASQGCTPYQSPEPREDYPIESITEKGRWWVDKEGKASMDEVWPAKQELFTDLHSLPAFRQRGAAIWASFRLNEIRESPIHKVWFSSEVCDYFTLYHLHGHQVDTLKGGSLIPHWKLLYRPNFMAIPIHNYSAPGQIVLLRFQNLGDRKLKVADVFLLSNQEERIMRNTYHDTFRTKGLYYFLFLTIVFFLLVIFAIQWATQQNPALLYYCLYLFACGLYYLRYWENSQFYFRPFFNTLGVFQLCAEILLAFFAYSCYMIFVSTLLEMPQRAPSFANKFKAGAMAFLVAIPAMWLTGKFAGLIVMETAYVLVRIAFFMASAIIIGILWKRHRQHPMTPFIVTGTSLLILGMIMTLSEEIFGGEVVKHIAGGAFGWYYHGSGDFRLPVYDFKFGVLLEIIIFSAGLAYRQKLMNEEYKMAKLQIQQDAGLRQSISPPKAGEKSIYPFPSQSDFITKAVTCVEQNINDDEFRVQQLADKLHITRETLYQKLRKELEMDPTLFMRTIRIYRGRYLLEQGKHTISEVAYSVGFKYPSHFTKVFKDEFGYKPSEMPQRKNP